MNSAHLGFLTLVALVGLQRLNELRRSKKHVSALLRQGGREFRGGHFIVMKVLHAGWLAAIVMGSFLPHEVDQKLLILGAVLFLLGQCLRHLAIETLGNRWTVTIVVLPRTPRIKKGIYRYVAHPNYWGVALEIAGLPLIYGLWQVALAFSIANAILLSYRIKKEEYALRTAALSMH